MITKSFLAFALLASASLAADLPSLVIESGGHQALPRFLAFTRDGKSLVSAGDDKVVRVWDIASGKTVRTIRGQIGDGQEGKIYAAALSPDERFLAAGGWLAASHDAGVIRIHNFRSGEVVAVLRGHSSVVTALAFSADGRWLASGSLDNTVRIWDTAGWKLVQTFAGHKDAVYGVAFSPDGRTLVSASLDRTLRLWDRASGLLLKEMTGHQMDVETVAFTPDGRYIASGGDDGTVKLWDGRSGAFIRDLAKQGGDVTRLVFSPDGRTLLATGGAGDSVCHVFEVASGREISRFSGHTNSVVGAAFSPDGKTVATAGGDRSEIFLWNPETAAVLHKLAGNGSQVWAVAYGQDRKSLAFGLTQKFASQNDRGPLEKTFLLDTDQGGGYL